MDIDRLKAIRPTIPNGGIGGGGGLGGQQFKSLGNVKRLDRLGINFAHNNNAGESGNGHGLNKLAS